MMIKKIYNICFTVVFLTIISVPLIFTNWVSGGVSEDENRNLAEMPELIVDDKFNDKFTSEFETWFMDHMGYRSELINFNATMQFEYFNRTMESSNYKLGRHGDVNYVTDAMLLDYAHLNLRSEEEVAKIGESYRIISDWLEERGIQFYYVQCWDKHSIYPEQYLASVNQKGDISKTDQIVSYVKNNTSVNIVPLKQEMIASKDKYEVYSNWGDPTHWTHRGSKIAYKSIMKEINNHNNNMYKVLQDEDYDIAVSDMGITLNGYIHRKDMLEYFTIKNPKAVKQDSTLMGEYAEDTRHSVWKNESAGNDTKLLLMCDSYFDSFIKRDFAESFSEVWLVWGDYTRELDKVIEMYQPDIVIYEHVERVDRSNAVVDFAEKLKSN